MSNKIIWVADAKSSINGVDAAAVAEGNPSTRLEKWLKQDWAIGEGATAENKAFANKMQTLIDSEQFQVKGITVQVGVPKLGTTGTVEVRFLPWN